MSTGVELTGRRRSRSSRERGDRSRDAILDAAVDLMAARGYAGTSISAICAACQLPPTSVYWHFGNKEGVLAAVLDRTATRYLDDFGAPDTTGNSTGERLDKLLTAMARFVDAVASQFQFLLVLGLREGQATELTTAVLRRVRQHIIDWLVDNLTDIYELADRPDGQRLAHDLATLVITVANGTEIARWIHREQTPFPTAHLKTALTAIANTTPPSAHRTHRRTRRRPRPNAG